MSTDKVPTEKDSSTPQKKGAAATSNSTQGTQSHIQSPESEWKSIESGTRPAFAGIHGGTAPVTLLRSSNGMLFAFTGQTGNDFTLVVRGGSANASAVQSPSTPEAGESASSPETPAVSHHESDMQETSAEKVRDFPKVEVDTQQEAEEVPSQQESPIALTPENHHQLSPSSAPLEQTDQTHSASSQPDESAVGHTKTKQPAQSSSTDSASSNSKGHQAHIAKQTEKAPTVEALLAPQGENREPGAIIFASGELAKELSYSEGVVPFGLPLPGEEFTVPSVPSPLPVLPTQPHLRLGDYRSILQHTGSL